MPTPTAVPAARLDTTPDYPPIDDAKILAAMRDLPQVLGEMTSIKKFANAPAEQGHRLVLASALVDALALAKKHTKTASAWAIDKLAKADFLLPEIATSRGGFISTGGGIDWEKSMQQGREVENETTSVDFPDRQLFDGAGPVPYDVLLVRSTAALWEVRKESPFLALCAEPKAERDPFQDALAEAEAETAREDAAERNRQEMRDRFQPLYDALCTANRLPTEFTDGDDYVSQLNSRLCAVARHWLACGAAGKTSAHVPASSGTLFSRHYKMIGALLDFATESEEAEVLPRVRHLLEKFKDGQESGTTKAALLNSYSALLKHVAALQDPELHAAHKATVTTPPATQQPKGEEPPDLPTIPAQKKNTEPIDTSTQNAPRLRPSEQSAIDAMRFALSSGRSDGSLSPDASDEEIFRWLEDNHEDEKVKPFLQPSLVSFKQYLVRARQKLGTRKRVRARATGKSVIRHDEVERTARDED